MSVHYLQSLHDIIDDIRNPSLKRKIERLFAELQKQNEELRNQKAELERQKNELGLAREKLELSRRESENLYRELAANLPNGAAFVVDRELRYVLAEGSAIRNVGMAPADFEGKTIWEALEPQLAAAYEPYLRGGLKGKTFQMEHCSHGRHFASHGVPLHDASQKIYAVLAVSYDVTDRKYWEEELRNSEAKMRSIFRAAPIGIGVVSDRILQEVNFRFCELCGYSREELIGKNARVVYPSDEECEKVGREKYDQIRKYGTGSIETRFQRKDGKIIDVLVSSTPLDPDDLSLGVTFTALDITERKRADMVLQGHRKQLETEVQSRTAEIEEQYRQLKRLNRYIRRMAQHTINTMENDRKALSKEIHDSIGGSLAAIKMLLETRLESADRRPPGGVMSLEAIISHLSDAIKESKRIAHQMRSLVLDDLGLEKAVSEVIRKFSEFYPQIRVDFRTNLCRNTMPDEIKTVIYRVVQEALNNAGKHSNADRVRIDLNESQNRIDLKIQDNGSGFDVSKTLEMGKPLQGYGMLGMKERVEICSGEFQVRAEQGKGTVLVASIPNIGR